MIRARRAAPGSVYDLWWIPLEGTARPLAQGKSIPWVQASAATGDGAVVVLSKVERVEKTRRVEWFATHLDANGALTPLALAGEVTSPLALSRESKTVIVGRLEGRDLVTLTASASSSTQLASAAARRTLGVVPTGVEPRAPLTLSFMAGRWWASVMVSERDAVAAPGRTWLAPIQEGAVRLRALPEEVRFALPFVDGVEGSLVLVGTGAPVEARPGIVAGVKVALASGGPDRLEVE